MTWLMLAGYVAGWILSVRLAVKFGGEEIGLFLLGFYALLWPLALAIAVPVLAISGLVWLATFGVKVRNPSN